MELQKAGTDYFSSSGTLGFAPGQTERQFTTQILSDNIDEGVEDFFIKFTVATGVYDAYFTKFFNKYTVINSIHFIGR